MRLGAAVGWRRQFIFIFIYFYLYFFMYRLISLWSSLVHTYEGKEHPGVVITIRHMRVE